MKKSHKKSQKKSQPKVEVATETLLLLDLRTQIETDAVDYEMTNERIKILEDRKKFLRTDVEKAVAQFGIEDSSGHKHLELDGAEVIYEKRVSPGFNSVAAEEILRKKKLLETVGRKVIIEQWELDEEKIYEAYEAGLISPKDLDQMFSEKVSWALKVKVDESKVPEYASLKAMRKKPKEEQPNVISEDVE